MKKRFYEYSEEETKETEAEITDKNDDGDAPEPIEGPE